MPIDTKNLGVLPPKLETSDYVAGAETGIVYEEVNKSGNWQGFLPLNEAQNSNGFDTSACVTYSATNIIEIQLNYFLNAGKIPADKLQKLKDWGYIENDKFNFSDRFTAKMSGTTPQGNHLQKVWDSIRHDGLVPESMWPSMADGWAEYYNEIPQQIKDFAKNILTIFDFKYEWIVTGNCGSPDLAYLKYHLKQAPIQTAQPNCFPSSDGIYRTCGSCATQHATTIYNIDDYIRDFDHYSPGFLKTFALDYPFPWLMKGVVLFKKDEPVPPVFSHKFEQDIKYLDKSEEVRWLQKALNILGYKLPITGFYGNMTRSAVKDFQFKYSVASIPVLLWNNGRYTLKLTRVKLNELLLNK